MKIIAGYQWQWFNAADGCSGGQVWFMSLLLTPLSALSQIMGGELFLIFVGINNIVIWPAILCVLIKARAGAK